MPKIDISTLYNIINITSEISIFSSVYCKEQEKKEDKTAVIEEEKSMTFNLFYF